MGQNEYFLNLQKSLKKTLKRIIISSKTHKIWEDSLIINTWEFNKDIADLFSLFSTENHTGFDQDDIHETEDNDDDDSMMADINYYD